MSEKNDMSNMLALLRLANQNHQAPQITLNPVQDVGGGIAQGIGNILNVIMNRRQQNQQNQVLEQFIQAGMAEKQIAQQTLVDAYKAAGLDPNRALVASQDAATGREFFSQQGSQDLAVLQSWLREQERVNALPQNLLYKILEAKGLAGVASDAKRAELLGGLGLVSELGVDINDPTGLGATLYQTVTGVKPTMGTDLAYKGQALARLQHENSFNSPEAQLIADILAGKLPEDKIPAALQNLAVLRSGQGDASTLNTFLGNKNINKGVERFAKTSADAYKVDTPAPSNGINLFTPIKKAAEEAGRIPYLTPEQQVLAGQRAGASLSQIPQGAQQSFDDLLNSLAGYGRFFGGFLPQQNRSVGSYK